MALGAQHASPCAPGRRRARIALETQPLPAALPAAVLRIALGLSITQRAARYSCGRSGHCANRTHLYIASPQPGALAHIAAAVLGGTRRIIALGSCAVHAARYIIA